MFTYPLGLRRCVNFGEAAALKAMVSCFHGRQGIFISNIVPRQVCTGMGLGGSCPGGGRLCFHREGAWLELMPDCVPQTAIVIIAASQYMPGT